MVLKLHVRWREQMPNRLQASYGQWHPNCSSTSANNNVYFLNFSLKVSPTAPTPLKSYGLNLCLTPRNKTCTPPEEDSLVYVAGDKCSENHLQFSLDSNGVLRHNCSGKMICPQSYSNGAKIVVSSSCAVENSKFERTPGQHGIDDDDNNDYLYWRNERFKKWFMEGSSNKRPLKRKAKN